MTPHYGLTFVQLIRAPFTDVNMVWGIVPLYFALLLNELTSTKANFRTAIQTGFSPCWPVFVRSCSRLTVRGGVIGRGGT